MERKTSKEELFRDADSFNAARENERRREGSRPVSIFPELDEIRRRYLEEPRVHSIVDVLLRELISGNVSPPDLAKMAVLATTIYAERYQAPVFIRIDENGYVESRRGACSCCGSPKAFCDSLPNAEHPKAFKCCPDCRHG